MKKRTIIALLVAVVLIFAGGILLTLGLSFAGDSTQESELQRQEITIEESFDRIYINTGDCDVTFAMFSGRADTQVTIVGEPENVSHSVTVEEGVLTVKMVDNRSWYDYIGIFHEEMEMKVYLPAAEYASAQVRTDTGDITILEEPFFREMLLRSDTGDISCVGVSGDVLDCMTTTGDISVRNSVPTFTKLQSNTGDLEISGSQGKEIHMTTNTGEVDAENVTAQMFTCSSDTGDVELKQVLAEDYLQVFTDTGDIDITNSDAPEVNIASSTGDIEVPAAWEFQRIEPNTGNIHFE